MTDDQLLRYSRHILLDAIGIEGQQRILASRVLIVGAGGLGSPAALYLASAGIGRITLADDDTVDVTNLQRQILHIQARVGMSKVESARLALAEINSGCEVIPLRRRLADDELATQVGNADIVLDCSDNFATRHAINRACVRLRKPLVSGAAIRFSGQISVYDLRSETAPCYHCLFPEGSDVEELRCATLGVFAPLTGIIGSMQAGEALKLAAGVGRSLDGRLLLLDALDMTWRSVGFKKDPECPVCGPSGVGRPGGYPRPADADRESAGGACRPASSTPAD